MATAPLAGPRAPRLWPLSRAAFVSAAYFVGTLLGAALRFPPTATSVLWPPNAILAGALVAAPPREWWLYLLAALPAHILSKLTSGFPLSLVTALYVTNCTEALLVAMLVRRLGDAPTRFDSFRRATALVAAVTVGVLLSSIFDAAIVNAIRGESFATVWRVRVFSNILTELCVVPPFVALLAGPIRGLIAGLRTRWMEISAMAAVAVLLGTLVLGDAAASPAAPVAPFVPIVLLPLMFWAGVRFGVAGVSLAAFGLATIASRSAIAGHRAFAGLPPDAGLISVQVYLSFAAALLMCMAGLLEERRAAAARLAAQLRFQELVASVSGMLVEQPIRAHTAFDGVLAKLGVFLSANRVLLLSRTSDAARMSVLSAWPDRTGCDPPAPGAAGGYPWSMARIERGEPVVCASIDDLPADAGVDLQSFQAQDVQSVLVMPVLGAGDIRGALAVHVTSGRRDWPAELVDQLRLVGEVLANALARLDTERALVASESLNTAILASLASHVAVLDAHGLIIAVNEGWLRFARETSGPDADSFVGRNYLDICRRAAAAGNGMAATALGGIERVLTGATADFSGEYLAPHPGGDRWYAMTVVPLLRDEGGAVISHTDVTSRREAELAVQRMGHDLAHVSRVSTMAELTASLAHQLNQPLTGILSNAQAARRFLERASPDLNELRDICRDIIEDSQHAGDAIRHLREMMARTVAAPVVLNLNTVLQEVCDLASSDAVIRNIDVRLDLPPGESRIRGDRIELHQVFLNLLVNAMDAVGQEGAVDRLVQIGALTGEDRSVVIAVADSGPGFASGAEHRVFEPFFTTKPGGVGMGLPVARSIVEAHGGRVWASQNPSAGVTFFVRLPTIEASLA